MEIKYYKNSVQTSQGPLSLLQLIFVQTKYSTKKLYNYKITNC